MYSIKTVRFVFACVYDMGCSLLIVYKSQSHSSSYHISFTLGRYRKKMRFIIPSSISAALFGASLVFVSSFRNASARLVASSDLREQVIKSKGLSKVKGDECFKLEADISNVRQALVTADVGILGCRESLTCLEDQSSSTGARCVDFQDTFVKDECVAGGYTGCTVDSDCCGEEKCSSMKDPIEVRVCSKNGVFCKLTGEECSATSDCCGNSFCARKTWQSQTKYCQDYSADDDDEETKLTKLF